MPYYAELARVTLEAGNQASLLALRVIVFATPKGYICTAETLIENKTWLRRLLRGFRFQELPGIAADDIYLVGVKVPQMPPLETIERFRQLVPEGMEQSISLLFLLGNVSEDKGRAERTIVVHFVTEESLGTQQLVGATVGRFVALYHGQYHVPANPIRFWQTFARVVQQSGLCERVMPQDDALDLVLTPQAAYAMLPSLLTIVSLYPS